MKIRQMVVAIDRSLEDEDSCSRCLYASSSFFPPPRCPDRANPPVSKKIGNILDSIILFMKAGTREKMLYQQH